jgi:hypothetical protein
MVIHKKYILFILLFSIVATTIGFWIDDDPRIITALESSFEFLMMLLVVFLILSIVFVGLSFIFQKVKDFFLTQ